MAVDRIIISDPLKPFYLGSFLGIQPNKFEGDEGDMEKEAEGIWRFYEVFGFPLYWPILPAMHSPDSLVPSLSYESQP